ncbi:PTS fructose transporter subunit IIA [Tetragenococcus halophilus subsp. flandriensis]|uniref:PTS sugar transporter subunit IIA n=1 Tax=Tetragenococcus halophilus TaxID=51669 RepID=UPI0023E97BBD|nr:PTS sugar transporter subunit IIA [Tetragenococcus halophilus]GMA08456.1 PTS fructose transporter subunit IIA [Tetragenococcus halophilus subsp. flandriensis]
MNILNDYMDKDLIFLGLKINEQKNLLEYMAKELNRSGSVNEKFIEKVIEREQEFPTGLQLEDIGVAIPHSDIDYVYMPAVAMAVLKDTVNFCSMENSDKTVPVSIVFMLAVSDGNKQLELLQEIMRIIQSKTAIKNIIKASTKEEVLKAINY